MPFFNIPVAADQQYVVNYVIRKYDAIIIDKVSTDPLSSLLGTNASSRPYKPSMAILSRPPPS